MLSRRGIDGRVGLFALLAIAFGGWAMTALRALDVGTWERIGPGMVPRAAASALVVVGVVVLIRAMTGIANAPPRPMWLPWRLILVIVLATVLFVEDIVVYFPDEPSIAALGARLAAMRLKAGPADILALILLQWTLAILIGVVATGEGGVAGLASLLAGALLGLAGTDVVTGQDRLPQIEALLELASMTVKVVTGAMLALAAIAVVTILCRVNPLPAMLAYLGAVTAEEQFRRAMLLTRGDPLEAVGGRPIALSALAITALLLLATLWYRWPWRGGRWKSGRS